MPGILFVTGGSGFVGTAVIDELVGRGYSINALAQHRPIDPRGGRVTTFKGDLFDVPVLDQALAGCEAAIHLVGIIAEQRGKGVTFERIHFEGTQAVVDAVKRAGIKRHLQMSAIGTRPDAPSEYHRTKWKAEEYVRESGLEWTIVRPSMIHGPKGDLMKMEAAWAKKEKMPFLFMPYFGAGVLGLQPAGKIQPVYVGDVAKAFADALEKPNTIGQTYEIAGPDQMDWPAMHKMVSTVLTGKKRLTMPIPVWYAKALTYIAPAAVLPFNREQVTMSQEDNTTDLGKFVEAFGWKPRGFEETLREYKDRL